MSNHEYVENKILKLPMGSVFVMSDLDNLATNNNLRQIIFRLENAGKIRRILPGIYERPYFIKSLNCYAAPDLNQVALAIARRNNWSIAPSGNVALNILGNIFQLDQVNHITFLTQNSILRIERIKSLTVCRRKQLWLFKQLRCLVKTV